MTMHTQALPQPPLNSSAPRAVLTPLQSTQGAHVEIWCHLRGAPDTLSPWQALRSARWGVLPQRSAPETLKPCQET